MNQALPPSAIPWPNDPIVLLEDQGHLRIGTVALNAALAVTIEVTPKMRLVIRAELSCYRLALLEDSIQVRFLSLDKDFSCKTFRVEPSQPRQGYTTVWLRPEDDMALGDLSAPVSTVSFLMPNIPSFIAHGVRVSLPRGGGRWTNEIRLRFGGWSFEIEELHDASERASALSSRGGYGITGRGMVERVDDSSFTWLQLKPQMEALRLYLSFACGRWTGPMLAKGSGAKGDQVWARLDVPLIVDSYFQYNTWFDTHQAHQLSEIWGGFMDLIESPTWGEAIKKSIYWYLRSNSASPGADGALILSQAALETLSWTYFVKSGRKTKTAYKKLRAEEIIRSLLTELRIPTDIPSALTELQSFANGLSTPDGPSAIAAIRNDLVHPEQLSLNLPATEAWILGQRLIELVVLRLCRFNGLYGDRTRPRWVGEVDRVPWA